MAPVLPKEVLRTDISSETDADSTAEEKSKQIVLLGIIPEDGLESLLIAPSRAEIGRALVQNGFDESIVRNKRLLQWKRPGVYLATITMAAPINIPADGNSQIPITVDKISYDKHHTDDIRKGLGVSGWPDANLVFNTGELQSSLRVTVYVVDYKPVLNNRRKVLKTLGGLALSEAAHEAFDWVMNNLVNN